MKKVLQISILAVIAIFLSSCAMHTGYMNNSASLTEANFSYVKQSISGYAEAMYVFGIGGLEKEALVQEAKAQMLKENPLGPNQTLANITVNWKNSFFVIVNMSKVTVTADVVEFKPEND
ncbi:MAG TPA: hypothetical protein P5514_06170 [Bacteroidales bacterium]|nr:hypothetical protein [Bacteroidales bacterium]HPE57878.1 hypothetical protein [Bacteroidales bacterium]HRX96514.1 hypothetical protein [Bacteroidales bacterium]